MPVVSGFIGVQIFLTAASPSPDTDAPLRNDGANFRLRAGSVGRLDLRALSDRLHLDSGADKKFNADTRGFRG